MLSLSTRVSVYFNANPKPLAEILTWYQCQVNDLDHCQGQDKTDREEGCSCEWSGGSGPPHRREENKDAALSTSLRRREEEPSKKRVVVASDAGASGPPHRHEENEAALSTSLRRGVHRGGSRESAQGRWVSSNGRLAERAQGMVAVVKECSLLGIA